MASLRKGSCYSTISRAYTRKSKVKGKAYIKTMPSHKIVRFDMGDVKSPFEYEVGLVSATDVQVRNNAIESARQVVNRNLQKPLGNKNYHFQIRAYPHHALREKKQLTGAGADRMSQGMSQAFGRVTNTAAQLRKGKTLFSIFVNQPHVEAARESLRKAKPRLPGSYRIVVKKITN